MIWALSLPDQALKFISGWNPDIETVEFKASPQDATMSYNHVAEVVMLVPMCIAKKAVCIHKDKGAKFGTFRRNHAHGRVCPNIATLNAT